MCNFASSKTYLNLAQLVVTDTFLESLIRFSKPCSISAWRPGKINGLFVQNMVASYYSLNSTSFSFLRKLFSLAIRVGYQELDKWFYKSIQLKAVPRSISRSNIPDNLWFVESGSGFQSRCIIRPSRSIWYCAQPVGTIVKSKATPFQGKKVPYIISTTCRRHLPCRSNTQCKGRVPWRPTVHRGRSTVPTLNIATCRITTITMLEEV